MIDFPLLADGITHLTDARYFAAWHPRFLCFPLGEGGLSLDYVVAIREWVEGPVCVVELTAPIATGAGTTFPPEMLKAHGVTHVQLPYGTDPSRFLGKGFSVITHLAVAGYDTAPDLAERLSECPGPVVLDFTEGGITYADLVGGHPFSTGMVREMIADREVFVRIDLTPDEVTAATDFFYGLALRGSGEEKVGYKSFDDLEDLLYALE